MLRFEIHPTPARVSRIRARRKDSIDARDGRPPLDGKGWIILAWVLWFGLSYGEMVIAQRSDRISSLVARLMRSD